jgi:hypothetical protein
MLLQGRVIKKMYGAGSKSEHQAVYLKSTHGEFKLRLPDANPFQDPRGKSIAAHGEVDKVSNQFFVSHWDEVPEKS